MSESKSGLEDIFIKCPDCGHSAADHNQELFGRRCTGNDFTPDTLCDCQRTYESIINSTMSEPELQLLVIDLGDCCVVKVEECNSDWILDANTPARGENGAVMVNKTFVELREAFSRIVRVNTKDLRIAETQESDEKERPRPFVKWVGGKRGIINELIKRLPSDISEYYEPFAGGAALFFSQHKRIKKAVLSDVNIDLLLTYQVIKKDVESLITKLKAHAEKHSDEYYYKIRAKHDLTDPVEIAARFIYLNKTCFNGLYRVNSKGEFNVPVGKYVNPQIVGELNLRACQDALSKATIKLQSYDKITPSEGSFVYFDPPYHPTSETAYFTQYSKNGFTEKDQIALRDFFVKLTKQRVNVMLSNSNTPFVQDLYKGYNIAIVDRPGNVNCKPNKRNSVEEVLITNYATPRYLGRS